LEPAVEIWWFLLSKFSQNSFVCVKIIFFRLRNEKICRGKKKPLVAYYNEYLETRNSLYLAVSAQIMLFVEMLKFSRVFFFPLKEDILVHENNCFWNIQFVDMESSKLINYSTIIEQTRVEAAHLLLYMNVL
jgi:hypothetical protein